MLIDSNHGIVFYKKNDSGVCVKIDNIVIRNTNLEETVYTRVATYDENNNPIAYTADSTCYSISYDTDVMTIQNNGITLCNDGTENTEFTELKIIVNRIMSIGDERSVVVAAYAFNNDYIQDYLNVLLIADIFSIKPQNPDNNNAQTITLPYFENRTVSLKVNVVGGTGKFRIKNIRKIQENESECTKEYVIEGQHYIDCQGSEQIANESKLEDVLIIPDEEETELEYNNDLDYRINKVTNEIVLFSKGIPYLEKNVYYDIEVCHQEKLNVPTYHMQIENPESNDYFTFVDNTEEEIKEYEKMLSCHYIIRYEYTQPSFSLDDSTLEFSWVNNSMTFDVNPGIIDIETSIIYTDPDNVDWCHIINEDSLAITIQCDENKGCERTCTCIVNGFTISVTQIAKKYIVTQQNVYFEYDEFESKTVRISNSFDTYNIESNWCSCQRTNETTLSINCMPNYVRNRRTCNISLKNTCGETVSMVTVKQEGTDNSQTTNNEFIYVYTDAEGEDTDTLSYTVEMNKQGNITTSGSNEITLSRLQSISKKFHIKTQIYIDEDWTEPIINSTITVGASAKWIEYDTTLTYHTEDDEFTIDISSNEDNNYGHDRYCYLTFTCNNEPRLCAKIKVKQEYDGETLL